MHLFKSLLIALVLLPMSSQATEEPSHTVIQSDGNVELRQYEPMLIAEVRVRGDMRDASSKGFRALADFIFGNNAPAEKIEMTAPVTRTKSTKIEMTAPVTREQTGEDEWVVAFVMPSKWTRKTLPLPNNPAVIIREEPGKLMATIRFSGLGRAANHIKHQEELLNWMAENGYSATGEPLYAGYDAPWVVPFLRRNEVMIPVTEIVGS